MELQLTSFVSRLPNQYRLDLTTKIINNSLADVIVFCGHTIGFVNEIERLEELIENKETEVIFELEDINSNIIKNCLYHIKNGEVHNLYTNQIFVESREINGNYQLADRFLHELDTRRRIEINGVNFLIIQCGEINILKNIQNEANRVEFRFVDDEKLLERFTKIINDTDIILNPIHTPMGNQGKLQKRREFLSTNKKYYFSVSNTKEMSDNLMLKSLQYAFYNGNEIAESYITTSIENSVSRIYTLFGASFC